ncbi:MAG: phosphoribosylformylglycinamidine synthase [Clostridiales bacterium]|nr:phosphoribosylformylglycinamidine synthase [Clostridiales bacterium]
MVYRVYVEKKPGLDHEAQALKGDLQSLLGIRGLANVRLFNRYDVEDIGRPLFEQLKTTVFAEPQLDAVTEELPDAAGAQVFAVEYLPGQFDQRADSASQCIQLISKGERPLVRSAKVYYLYGDLTAEDVSAVKKYVINPVESREASLAAFDTLKTAYEMPPMVETLDGFQAMDRAGRAAFVKKYGLAMDEDDLEFCQEYFRKEGRAPTLTEIRMLDTYWSDHCRHTTFLTRLKDLAFDDPAAGKTYQKYLAVREELKIRKPVTLMDMATIGAKYLKKQGLLDKLDESEEINACTVKIDVETEKGTEKWLLLFKNETHNHPTEIEPFGGAATCIGGAIRDPLSGRAYVYAAMRVTGAADPTVPLSETLPGKLPQRKLVTTAAAGYSSYGNQIGLATGEVHEIYHPGYAAKRMEIGAVIAAAPRENVRREVPAPGDKIILLGGRTGRDGCGGATGSSKAHTLKSIDTCGAEVQKGNAPEERKLQRLFRSKEASLLIKRCNDFGAGGVSVAIGELADGIAIDLDKVPKKYEGLDGTELAISESQERMAVVVAPEDAEKFIALADAENLEATVVATVQAEPRLTMKWRGETIVDISRAFLNSNGAPKEAAAHVTAPRPMELSPALPTFVPGLKAIAGDLNVCSQRGLSERFDSTIGAGTVLMPFGGKYQLTPTQAMVHKISREEGDTGTVSFMAWGYDPFITEASPYRGAYLAVVQSVAKLIAAGADRKDVYLTFQEYFEKPLGQPERWGKPLAALLGALQAQWDLGCAAIGGKDSMSGTFEHLDVPPTLVSFAVTTGRIGDVRSPEFKGPGHDVVLLTPDRDENGLPAPDSLKEVFSRVHDLLRSGKALSAWALGGGTAAEACLKMALGNGLGIDFQGNALLPALFAKQPCGFVLELSDRQAADASAVCRLGRTSENGMFAWGPDEAVSLDELKQIYEGRLEKVYPAATPGREEVPVISAAPRPVLRPASSVAVPRVLIPVFPGTNCEYDSLKAVEAAGLKGQILVLNNLSAQGVSDSVERFAKALKNSQIVFIPGGFSGGDEPDGSGKFITAFFRSAAVADGIRDLMDSRDGLMLGICNGFQALIKLGLVPSGRITAPSADAPTLTYNRIGRHQSRLVRTRVASNNSPWLMETKVGDVFTVPVSHGEGRFLCDESTLRALIENGQVATQYVDLSGAPTDDILFNPNGSVAAIEGILSPDGRVLGKMGHSERVGSGLYRNVPGNYDMGLFRSAKKYFG